MHSLVNTQVVDVDESTVTFYTLEITLVVSLMNPETSFRSEAQSTLVAAVLGLLSGTTLVVNETCQFGEAFPTFTTPVVLVATRVNDDLVHFKARPQSELSSTLVTMVALWQDEGVTLQHWIEKKREMKVS